MLYKIIPFVLLLLNCIQCSRVVDKGTQALKYDEYCPRMPYCPEGSHVMCMYYNPDSVYGPLCRNTRNVSITTKHADKILEIINGARSKIARGKEKGLGDVEFPRGYGIFRLRWDAELATFAQLLANQCVLRHDLCRATKKFPEPGQTASLTHFTMPDWRSLKKAKFTNKGLDDERVNYAILQSLKTWYMHKNYVTIPMLTTYTNWLKQPHNQHGRLYMETIYGPATHLGCGISAYSQFAYYANGAPLNYNCIQIVCNISARPRAGGAVFNTVPPSDTDTTFNSCGCPLGSEQDSDCLCNPIETEPTAKVSPDGPQPLIHNSRTCSSGTCDSTVLLLPIFTMEDAPPEKLISADTYNTSNAVNRKNDIDSFEELFDNNVLDAKKFLNEPEKSPHTRLIDSNGHLDPLQRTRPIQTNNAVSVKNRHFSKKPNEMKHHDYHETQKPERNRDREDKHGAHRKLSIFGKTPRFELPGTHSSMTSNKKDVMPRKDFSESKKLADKYLFNQQNFKPPTDKHMFTSSFEQIISDLNELHSLEAGRRIDDLHTYLYPKSKPHKSDLIDEVQFHDILTTETVLNTAEQSIINHNNHLLDLNLPHNYGKVETETVTVTENDNKLLALLDTLEQEVKHVELQDNEKKIFDEKIKKIYGKVVGKPVEQLSIKKLVTKHVKQEHDLKKHAKEIEDAVHTKENDNIFEDDNGVHKLEPPHDKLTHDYNNHPNYHRESQNIENEDVDKFTKPEFNDIESVNYPKIPMLKKSKAHSKTDIIPYMRLQNRNNNRLKHHNEISSFEYARHMYDNNYKGRKMHKSNSDRNMLRNDRLKHRSNSLDFRFGSKNRYGNEPWYEDPLSMERRKYYQDKLDTINLKLQGPRHYSHRNDLEEGPRHMRAMRPNVRSSNNMMDPLYTPGRSRFLHGY